MTERCPECSGPLVCGDACRDAFHALLVLEGQVPGAPGSLVHFLTVACYVLQHPDSMNYTAEALHGLRLSLADVLDGPVWVDELRRRAGRAAAGGTRITRRAGDPQVAWPRGGWTMTAVDVLAGGADEYAQRVRDWATSIRRRLEAGSSSGTSET